MGSETPGSVDPSGRLAVALAGDEQVFGELVEAHRHELRVHCYRMLGSYDDAEDLVQETYLRAWRRRETYGGRSTFRAWLYRIATNACLDLLARRRRRVARYASAPLATSAQPVQAPAYVPWLQPYPDSHLEVAARSADEPTAVAVERETIELAFMVAVQHLPPRQRAVLILRDIVGWSADETAETLDTTVASVKSALQRARATVREHLPADRDDWRRSPSQTTAAERDLATRYVRAFEDADTGLLATLLADDVRVTMPPHPEWLVGSDALLSLTSEVLDRRSSWYHGRWRGVLTAMNRQPAVAFYVERPTAPLTATMDGSFRAQVLDVLGIVDGTVSAVTSFDPDVFGRLDLPLVLA